MTDFINQDISNRKTKKSLFEFLTKNSPSIIEKFIGNIEDLKSISFGTMVNTYKWKCDKYSECSNIFEARPRDVFRNDTRQRKYCNLCKNKERGKTYQKNILEKNGSIQTKFPDIINIWCEDNKFKSNELTANSHEIVKLKCPNKFAKHPDYEISVYNINNGNSNCFINCPKCSVKTSKAEMRIYSELKYIFKDVKWLKKIEGREADIIIEDLKLVIEVDGFPWHMDKTEKDLAKNDVFKKNGYSVLRIRDSKLGEISCDSIICDLSDLSITQYNKIVEWLNNKHKSNIDTFDEFQNSEYYKEIHTSSMSVPYDESLEYLFPESKELWDYEKNHPFIPSQFRIGSNLKVWVKCKSGHSHESQINHMFRIRNDVNYENERQIKNCPECPKPKYKSNNPNQRIIIVNGKSYNNITECCRELKITRTYLYEKMKAKGIDKNVMDNIQKLIEEFLKSRML